MTEEHDIFVEITDINEEFFNKLAHQIDIYRPALKECEDEEKTIWHFTNKLEMLHQIMKDMIFNANYKANSLNTKEKSTKKRST